MQLHPLSRLAACGLAWLLCLSAALADHEPDPADVAAGHSLHGEAFDDGPRQAATLLGGTGRVRLPVTTKNPQVQDFINQGVGQLHGFWYFEAERSFRQAAALDPDCAMAYWGMAMANINNAKRARGFIAEAVKHKASASPREQLWIDALDEYHREPKVDKAKEGQTPRRGPPGAGGPVKNAQAERRQQYIQRLEKIVYEYPDELEAKAFLLAHLWDSSSRGVPIASNLAVDALIGEVLKAEPMHPVHHYRIHLWDSPKPERALTSAALCGPSAPTIAHMWHMPGHIYSRLKRYGDAAWQQEASGRVDHLHMMQDHVLPDQIHNYAHNQEWMIRNLSYIGRAHQAADQARNLIELPRHPRYNTLAKGSSFYGRLRLVDVLSRYELWDELIAAAGNGYWTDEGDRSEQLKRAKALGAAYFQTNDKPRGLEQLAKVQKFLDEVRAEQAAATKKAVDKATQEKKPAADVAKAKAAAEKTATDALKPFEQALAEVHGHHCCQVGDYQAALAHFEKAGLTNKEFLSRVQLAAGDKAKAEQLAREAVTAGPQQVYPLANLVDILWRLDKNAEAGKQFDQLRTLGSTMDLDLPICRRLRPLARERGLAEDWRLAVSPASDLGPRPPLDKLGPVHWKPTAAADFKLVDSNGKSVSLADYRGKPVVLLFYLGFGCVHCVEQLQTFSPLEAEFASQGISLLAISSDDAEALRDSLTAPPKGKAPITIRLASDADQSVFKAYRAFDDFEHCPLHATILVDGRGMVRWQDISYEPFTDARFLIKEARRLLGQSSTTPLAGARMPLMKK